MIRVVTKHSIKAEDSSYSDPWFVVSMLTNKEDDIPQRAEKNIALATTLTALINNGKSVPVKTGSIEIFEHIDGTAGE